jgi:penicillin amidase
LDGASGDYEWEEYNPYEQLPRAFNPPSGKIVTANQNPFPPDYAYRVGGDFASPYRARQISDRLRARGGWRAAEMPRVQTDVYSAFHDRLAREIVAAVSRKKAGGAAAEAAAVLRGWNGQMAQDIAAPMIAVLAEQHLARALEERAAPKQQPPVDLRVAPAVLEQMLSARPAAWFSDWDGAVVEAVGQAVEEGRRIQGRDLRQWDWGAYNRLLIAHPVGARLPLVGRYFNAGPAPQSGSRTSVKAATRRFGASMRFVADTGDWDRSSLTLPTGVSGHVLSSHYKDQWDAYYRGGSVPLAFRAPKIKDTLAVEP